MPAPAPISPATPTSMSGFANAAPAPAANTAPTSMSGFANAAPATGADEQNYQNAAANLPAPTSTPNPITTDIEGVGSALVGKNITPTARTPVTAQSYLTDIYGTPDSKSANGSVSGGIVGDTLDAWTKAASSFQSLGTQPTVGGRVAGLAQTGLDAINAFFTPVSTVFNEAAKVPGSVGDVAGYVNNIFSHIGIMGGDTLASYVQNGPFTDSQKATLAPLAQQIGALGLQIVAGGAGEEAFSGLKDTTHSFLSTLYEDQRIKQLQNNPDIQAAIQKQQAAAPATQSYEGEVLQPGTPESKAALESAMPGGLSKSNIGSEGQFEKDVPRRLFTLSDKTPVVKPGTPESQAVLEAGMPKLNAPKGVGALLGEGEQPAGLLGEGQKGSPIKGEGFTATDKADKTAVTKMKAINDYRDKLASYNKNPTPTKLDAVQKARTVRDEALKAPAEINKDVPGNSKKVAETPSGKVYNTPNTQDIHLTNNEGETFKISPEDAKKVISSPKDQGQKITKSAADINKNLVKQGMNSLTEEQQAKYTSGSYKNSGEKVAEMLTSDRDSVIKMASTGEDIPADVHPQILFNAARAAAEADFKISKDPTELMELAKSPLNTERSESAAQLGSSGYNSVRDDSTEALRKASDAKRGGEKGEKAVKAETKNAKTTISKTRAKLIDYEKIMDALTC